MCREICREKKPKRSETSSSHPQRLQLGVITTNPKKCNSKNEDYPKKEENSKNEDNSKNKNSPKNEDGLKIEDDLKNPPIPQKHPPHTLPLKIYLMFFWMTSHRDSHSTTDV